MARNSISELEYLQIEEDIMIRNPARFDLLCTVTEELLKPFVYSRMNERIQMADDVMQNIQLKVIKGIATNYFQKDTGERLPEKNANGLQRWLFTIAKNEIYTLHNREQRIKNKHYAPRPTTEEEDLDMLSSIPDTTHRSGLDRPGRVMEMREGVNRCIASMVTANSKEHIVLATVMVALISLHYNCDRIRAERYFSTRYAQATLDEVFMDFIKLMQRISWITVSTAALMELKTGLDQPRQGQRTGSYTMQDFAMKKGLDASLSDWLNRMDGRIKRNVPDIYEDWETDPV